MNVIIEKESQRSKLKNLPHFYKTIKSPLGQITVVATDKALVALYMQNEEMPKKKLAKENETHELLFDVESQLDEYFNGHRKDFDLPLDPEGTDFQNRAWSALVKIPYGKVWSYGQQALHLKTPNAQRAVGGANGKNPIPIIIPCHRVIGSTGKLTGFAGGMAMKIFLLRLEGHQVDEGGLKVLR